MVQGLDAISLEASFVHYAPSATEVLMPSSRAPLCGFVEWPGAETLAAAMAGQSQSHSSMARAHGRGAVQEPEKAKGNSKSSKT